MPPRHAYWTILVDEQPTAFRAHDPEELLPTLNRLKEKNPSAVMKWFERGRLWESRDAARDEGFGKGERRWEGPRPEPGASSGSGERRPRQKVEAGPKRGKDWRPGGEHRDPRQKYKDAKKAKWQRFKQTVRSRWEEKTASPNPETFSPPHGDPLRDQIDETRPVINRPEDREGPPSRPHDDPVASRARGGWRDDKRGSPPPKGAPRSERPPRRDDDRGGWQARDKSTGWKPKPADARGAAPDRSHRDSWREDRPPREDTRGGGWKPQGPPRGDRPPRRDDDRGGWQGRDKSSAWKPTGPPRDGRPPRDDTRGGGWKPTGPPRGDRPRRDDDRGGWQGRERSGGEWRDRPPRDRDARGTVSDRPRDDRRGDSRDKPRSSFGGKKPFGAKPAGNGRGPKPFGERKPWGTKPGGGKGAGARGTRRPPSGGSRRPPGPRGPKKPRGE